MAPAGSESEKAFLLRRSMSPKATAAGYDPPSASESALELKVVNAMTPAKAAKDAVRYQQILNDNLLKPDAQRIPYRVVLCSMHNRQGAALNTRYTVEDLGPRIKGKTGFAPERARVGMVRQVRSVAAKSALVCHNAKMRKCAVGHYPPLAATVAHAGELFECVGGNHLTITIGCFGVVLVAYNGFVFEPPPDDVQLSLVITEGHLYYVLKESTSDDDMAFLSEYLNASQNQDQCHSEMHLQAAVRNEAFRLLADKPYVNPGIIIQNVCNASVVKLRGDNVGDTVTWVIPFHGSDHLENLEHWHGSNVNPNELTVSSRFFADTSAIIGPTAPIVKISIARVQYSGDERLRQTRPTPDVSRTISTNDLETVVKRGFHLQVEAVLQEVRAVSLPILTPMVGRLDALQVIWPFEDAASRLMLGRSLGNVGFAHGVSGKFAEEKLKSLRDAWVRHCVASNPGFKPLVDAIGVKDEDESGAPEEVLCPGNFDGGVFHKNPIASLFANGFTIGAKLILTRRCTFEFTLPNGKKERADVGAGTETFVKGYVDDNDQMVTCEFEHSFGKRAGICDAAVRIKNLELAVTYAARQSDESATKKGKARHAVLDLVTPEAGVVPAIVKGWPSKLMSARSVKTADDMAAFITFLGHRVAECCPDLDTSDLTVVRNGDSYEVWTARDFKAGTLMICPETTEVKQRHFTRTRSALVHTNSGEQGLKQFFLDGRVRSNPESDKHSFSLFYLVTRPGKADGCSCNLVLEQAAFTIDMTIDHPQAAKPSQGFGWDASEAPTFPYMVNPAKIPKDTKLLCLQDSAVMAFHDKLAASAAKEKEAAAAKSEKEKADAAAKAAKEKNAESSKAVSAAKKPKLA